MSGIESTQVLGDDKVVSCEQIAEAKVRMLTWNINGLRKVAASHGGLGPLLDQFEADIGETGGTKRNCCVRSGSHQRISTVACNLDMLRPQQHMYCWVHIVGDMSKIQHRVERCAGGDGGVHT